MKPSQLARRRAQHLIVFGDPKTGKSSLAAELLLHGFRLTWLSMDNGHEILWKLPLSPEKLDEQLNIIVLPDTKEFPVAISTCLKVVSGKAVDICDRHGQADCSVCKRAGVAASWSRVDTTQFGPKDILVFDHIGQLANSAMNFILKGKDDDYKPEWEHYRIQGTLMDKFLTNIQASDYNVICITHVTETTMEDDSKKLVPLVGTVPFSRNVGKYFDHMIYCQIKNKTHRFGSKTGYENTVVTGSRSDVAIEDNPKDPSLKKFFDGSLEAEKEEVGKKAVVQLFAGQTLHTSRLENEIVTDESGGKTVEEVLAKVNTPDVAAAVKTTTDRLSLLASLKKGK